MEKEIRVLVYEPGQIPYEKTIQNELPAFQQIIGGYIEAVPLTNKTFVICDEDGKLKELPQNRIMVYETGHMEVIVGTFFVCGAKSQNFRSLTDTEVEEVKRMMP